MKRRWWAGFVVGCSAIMLVGLWADRPSVLRSGEARVPFASLEGSYFQDASKEVFGNAAADASVLATLPGTLASELALRAGASAAEAAKTAQTAVAQAKLTRQLKKALEDELAAALQAAEGVRSMPFVEVHADDIRVERVPLEIYVRGVVAGEMPGNFEMEALKAQAIAARTYIIRRMAAGTEATAVTVTATEQHQVYLPLEQLVTHWPADEAAANIRKLNEAVKATEGLILTYEEQPIEALYFSTSNGYTENAQDYWQHEVPYLQSVSSPWDEALAPRFEETVTLTLKEFRRKLEIKKGAEKKMRITERTAGQRIGTIQIGDKAFSGREFRERLGLLSSDVRWHIQGGNIELTTRGYGHGVGMSQWGAQGMAKEGRTAEAILSHYYKGTNLENYQSLTYKRVPSGNTG